MAMPAELVTGTLPQLLVPATGAADDAGALVADCDASLPALLAWAADQRDELSRRLHHHGALLLRGFAIDDAEDFARVCEVLGGELAPYVGGDSPRSKVGATGRVYTSTEFPAHLEVGLHNEMSYAPWWPSRVFFWCRVAAASGGATHIADGRQILAALPPALVERFERLGVAYLQHLPENSAVHKTWPQTFETHDRGSVERWCTEHGVEYEWTATGLRTRALRPGVITHPFTGERVWFNQADQWWSGGGSVKQRVAGDGQPASDATFGDGSPLQTGDMVLVGAALHDCEVVRSWRAGELLVLDNLLTLHGRKPFEGERSVLVALA